MEQTTVVVEESELIRIASIVKYETRNAELEKYNESLGNSYSKIMFPDIRGNTFQITSNLFDSFGYGSKKDRLKSAKELHKLSQLYINDELYISEKYVHLPTSSYPEKCKVGGSFLEMLKVAGYDSKEDFYEIVHNAIEKMYKTPVYHYSDTITDPNELLPLSKTNAKTLTSDDGLDFRKKVEKELDIVDCLYATTRSDLREVIGEYRLEIDTSKYEVMYHIGDTLDASEFNHKYTQKPFKKGQFDIQKQKYIPHKKEILENGAEALALYTFGYGHKLIEVLLKPKK